MKVAKWQRLPLSIVLARAPEFIEIAKHLGVSRNGFGDTKVIGDLIDEDQALILDQEYIRPWIRERGYPQPGDPKEQVVRGLLYAGIAHLLPPKQEGEVDVPPPQTRTPVVPAHILKKLTERQKARLRQWAGAKSQRLLFEGLGKLLPKQEQAFVEQARAIESWWPTAMGSLVGACAMRRVVHSLSATDIALRVRLGTLAEDLTWHTDLVVTPSKSTHGGGILVQVKSGQAHMPPCVWMTGLTRPGLFDLPPILQHAYGVDLAGKVWGEVYRKRLAEQTPWQGFVVIADPHPGYADPSQDAALTRQLRSQLLASELFGPAAGAEVTR